MNHLELAFRNLRRRPTRSILTSAGVALAVGSFITLYGLSQSVEQNLEQSIEEHGTDLTVRRAGTAELFGGTMLSPRPRPVRRLPASPVRAPRPARAGNSRGRPLPRR